MVVCFLNNCWAIVGRATVARQRNREDEVERSACRREAKGADMQASATSNSLDLMLERNARVEQMRVNDRSFTSIGSTDYLFTSSFFSLIYMYAEFDE